MDFALAVLALVFFAAALGFLAASWFCRGYDRRRTTFYLAVVFALAGFVILIYWRFVATPG